MSDLQKQYKPGEIIDGKIKVMSNGGGYDLETKRIAIAPGTYFPDPNRITTANASEMAQKGNEARQAKVEARLVKEIAAIDPDMPPIAHADDAWAAIVGKQGVLAYHAVDRDSTGAARFVGRALNYLADKGRQVMVAIQVNVIKDPGPMDDDW